MVLDTKAEMQLKVAHAPDALLLRSCKYVEFDAAFDLECCGCIEDFDGFGPVLLAHDRPVEFYALAFLEASMASWYFCQVFELAEGILECVVSQRFHLLVVICWLSMYDEISVCVGPDSITDVFGKSK
jgi:hypothetical protein